MLTSCDKYTVHQINNSTVYIFPDFNLISLSDVVAEVGKDLDSTHIRYIIQSNTGIVEYINGHSTFYTKQAEPIKPMIFDTDEFIDDALMRTKLKKIRAKSKKSQKEMSEITGLSVQCISNLESADPKQSPTLRSLLRYMNCLGYELDFKEK